MARGFFYGDVGHPSKWGPARRITSERHPMRALFGIVSLLVVLAVVGVLTKKQLGSTTVVVPGATPGTTAQQQSQQVQDQFKQSLEGALQPTRPLPDDSK